MRDPRHDPQEGDVLYEANGTRELLIDKVSATHVSYRVTDGSGGLLAAYQTTLDNWKESAPYICDGSDLFCPRCDGRGVIYRPGALSMLDDCGASMCMMCGGSGSVCFKEDSNMILGRETRQKMNDKWEQLEEGLMKFDWHYERSDDHRTWQSGVSKRNELKQALANCASEDQDRLNLLIRRVIQRRAQCIETHAAMWWMKGYATDRK